ncbi:hypothetical protein [Mycobacterium heckeshornense]|uniref:hypothetical protein n=1 Tax=Mycobacterium heckeshornense TaxID=110505 RepID=UPI000662AD47|nr:hypothetical protein [Mycobacterium heckeshornense]
MARDAIYSLLKNDTTLAELGGDGFTVLANFTGDQRPNDKGAFMVIRWGVTDYERAIQDNGPRHFDIWVHIPASVSTDYVRIDNIFDRVDELFGAANEASQELAGADGRTVTVILPEGRSGDFEDEGYMTICRRASYQVLSYKPVA